METKVCTKCKEEKPATTEYFTKDKNNKTGYFTYCKICKNKSRNYKKEREINKIWIQNNRERRNKTANLAKKIRYANMSDEEKRKTYIPNYEWRKNNREKYLEYRKKWREKNKEIENERVRNWRLNNPEKLKDSAKKTYIKRLELIKKYNKNYNKRTERSSNRCKNLEDEYIIQRLTTTGFNRTQIKENTDLIEVKRILLKTKRLCKILAN